MGANPGSILLRAWPRLPPILVFSLLSLPLADLGVAPVVYNLAEGQRGHSFYARCISLDKFIEEREALACIYDPLTEFECSDDSDADDGTGGPAANAQADGTQGKAVPASRKEKQRQRKACRRRVKRSKQILNQVGDPDAESRGGGEDIKAVAKRRRVESTKDALKAGFDLETYAEVTRPGWIGRSLADLPQTGFTRAELQAHYGLTYFSWDGR
jgi:hypothetical protein